ncbi:Ferritin light chain 2 [Myotis brandtii]|uniref:Ferritin light chain 2 n=1 Tax=Myotis brandtii TaxID=109478 RepID=S7MVI7_MYOBR|nr:Ferritin light chain 2 [Myotis brandtii]
MPNNHELPNSSELFHRLEAAVDRPASLHLRARTYLSPDEVAAEGGGRFFLELVAEKHEGAQRLEAVKPARWRLLFQDELPPPREEEDGREKEKHQ